MPQEQQQIHYEYREARNLKELEALLELRYEVYSQDPELNKMLEHPEHDLNDYDLQALHFGVFEETKPIAYIRLVLDSQTHFTPWVKQLFEKKNTQPRFKTNTFPFQNCYPDSNWSSAFLASLTGRKLGEVGRLAVHPDYRQGGLVLTSLIQAFIKYCKEEQKIQTGFGSCTLSLERFYRKFDFNRAENSVPFIYKDLPEAVIVRFDA